MAKASCCPRWMMEYKGPLPTGSLPSLTSGFLTTEAKLRMHLVHSGCFGDQKNTIHTLGQGEDEGIGKTLGFSMSLNHGKGFQMSINHVSVDLRGTGTLMPPRLPSHLSSLLISVSAPFFKWLFPP